MKRKQFVALLLVCAMIFTMDPINVLASSLDSTAEIMVQESSEDEAFTISTEEAEPINEEETQTLPVEITALLL